MFQLIYDLVKLCDVQLTRLQFSLSRFKRLLQQVHLVAVILMHQANSRLKVTDLGVFLFQPILHLRKLHFRFSCLIFYLRW